MKYSLRLGLLFMLILVFMVSACNPGDTHIPAPLNTNLPGAATTANFVNSPETSNPSAGATIPSAGAAMRLVSPDFANDSIIPKEYTCNANSISPQLQFSNIPPGTQSLALTLEDPDAPLGVFVHWVIYNILPTLAGLSEDVPKHADISGVGTQGLNGAGLAGYTGPCPTTGNAHHYIFTLYALDIKPNLADGLNAAGLYIAMQGHILAQAVWVGLYQK